MPINKYKFLGKPDWRFPFLKTGKIYELKIREVSKGFLGWLVGNTKPLIVKPFGCPYASWDSFHRNWQEV